jgi:hypothetical protein
MKRILALLLFAPIVALAQTAVSGAGSTSGAAAGAHAGAISGSAIIINTPADTTARIRTDADGGIKTVPNVIAPNILPSAVCHGVSSAGLSVLGFGASGGSSWQDADCQFRETARIFHAMGMVGDAVKVLCSSTFAAAAPSCASVNPQIKKSDAGDRIAEPGEPGGSRGRGQLTADQEFCQRPEVKADKILAERNGCQVPVATSNPAGRR